MPTQTLQQALHIVGIALHTHNGEAFDTIPQHWQRFGSEQVLSRIPNKLSDDVYAVYTRFENSPLRPDSRYTLIIGAAVTSTDAMPEGMSSVTIPPSLRKTYPVEPATPQQVGATWLQLWQEPGLQSTAVADFERFTPDGRIEISIGVA
ncbi:GyrI-like domain-containing protein [Parachitinimonas caeni]|uniref:GyrI-like domain-containing protein n=1 Tax=Parachitinimonas caeni TaxID=3031301 RepID=A0ABT7E2R3_9NEIS|nr:GyrI-like domain-containing protein [Parachitinimonas caeni]MDK2126600.1 GyrI-like domain-containing protein [Parachitinimonas caeni]